MFAAIPAAVAMLLIGGLMVLGVWGAGAAASAMFGEPSGDLGEAGLFATRIFFYVLAVLVAIFAGIALAQLISGPALDRIVRAQEQTLGGRTRPDPSFTESLGRSLRVTLTTLAIGVPIMILLTAIELVFPPVAVVTMPCSPRGISSIIRSVCAEPTCRLASHGSNETSPPRSASAR